jgi:hypothetical protein
MVDFRGSQMGLDVAMSIAAAARTGLEMARETITLAEKAGFNLEAHSRNGWTTRCIRRNGQVWLELTPDGGTNCAILRALLVMIPKALAPSLHHDPTDHLVMRLV